MAAVRTLRPLCAQPAPPEQAARAVLPPRRTRRPPPRRATCTSPARQPSWPISSRCCASRWRWTARASRRCAPLSSRGTTPCSPSTSPPSCCSWSGRSGHWVHRMRVKRPLPRLTKPNGPLMDAALCREHLRELLREELGLLQQLHSLLEQERSV